MYYLTLKTSHQVLSPSPPLKYVFIDYNKKQFRVLPRWIPPAAGDLKSQMPTSLPFVTCLW
jgi:hypothetical protein